MVSKESKIDCVQKDIDFIYDFKKDSRFMHGFGKNVSSFFKFDVIFQLYNLNEWFVYAHKTDLKLFKLSQKQNYKYLY